MEVRQITRSSSATHHPKVYTSTNLLSQDIVDSVSRHRRRVLSWHSLVIARWVKDQLSQN
jgi:hypothetical protein